jgi:hypothetical protein
VKRDGIRSAAKRALGRLPWAPELLQAVRPAQGRIPGGYRLDRLEAALPGWLAATDRSGRLAGPGAGKRVLIVAGLRWWVEYSVALGLLLEALGHRVDLAYLPYRRWWEPVSDFDLRRQGAYLGGVLSPLQGRLGLRDLSAPRAGRPPVELESALREGSLTDVQYTLQREEIDLEADQEARALFELRLRRNRVAAAGVAELLQGGAYDVVVIPNGTILEFGACYRVARELGVGALTYEFGEQRERMWLARDDEVMRLDTSALWAARGDTPLTEQEREELEALVQARRGGRRWANFARQWQAEPSKGAKQARQALKLDPNKPLALLCTNVVGDSLALGRQVFTRGMADWLRETVRYFAGRSEAQLVVRVHPGELLGAGHPSVDIVRDARPDLPDHVTVVPPDSEINTYDLIELADVGLVYTTTVGMEMAMRGLPVVVSGRTHYRDKGFTHDPQDLQGYFRALDELLASSSDHRLPAEEAELAWRYAHRFFFEYPFPFPWHLVSFWEDIQARPFEAVLGREGRARYARAFGALLGEPILWRQPQRVEGGLP